MSFHTCMDFPGSSAGKESTCKAGDSGLNPGLGRPPGEGVGQPLWYAWASLVSQRIKNPPGQLHLAVQSCPTLCHSMDCSPPGSPSMGILQARKVECRASSLLQGNFLTQDSNRGLLHFRWILYQLSYQGSSPCTRMCVKK